VFRNPYGQSLVMIQEIELTTAKLFITGEVEFEANWVDDSFDYEYGSEKGTHHQYSWEIEDVDFSKLEVFAIEDEDAKNNLTSSVLTKDDEHKIEKLIDPEA